MTEDTWSRVEGMVIAPDLDPKDLATELQSRGVVAKLDWFDATPSLVGLVVGVSDGAVATLPKRAKNLQPGQQVVDLVRELAEALRGEVMIGDASFFAMDKDQSAALVEQAEKRGTDELVRLVEIGHTPPSAIPLLAAFEGVDIAELPLPGDKRMLAAQLPSSREDWYFGDLPVVVLSMKGDEFKAFFAGSDDPESVISYNWGMEELTVAGAKGWENDIPENVADLVGSRSDILLIHEAVPGVDVEAAVEASALRGPEAVRKFVAALGLQADIAEFLLGHISVQQISGASLHHARGISNAIGRSVDILIDEKHDGSKFWNAYTDLITSKPWLIPVATGAEALAGVGLLVAFRKREGSRGALAKMGTAAGALMLFDSFAQNALAKYTAIRLYRREERQNPEG